MKTENKTLPLDLQMFAEDPEDKGGKGGDGKDTPGTSSQGAPSFDYDKLASIISGKQDVAEKTVLKNYFKEQGLSQDEANAAIEAFKKQKKETEPNAGELQKTLETEKAALLQQKIENTAIMEAMTLGLDQKTIPYVIKMADMSDVIVDGEIKSENVNKALSKVLEDVPQLKPTQQDNAGFRVGGGGNKDSSGNEEMLAKIFGN